jgi:hypothetical protein
MAGCAPKLATFLDQERIELAAPIAPRGTPTAGLPLKAGVDVYRELGGRFLLRYLRVSQVDRFALGSATDRHFVTPTPYGPEDAVRFLYLPAPVDPPTFVLVIDPSKVDRILGPRWVRMGDGIEYILPEGFTREALVTSWEMTLA